VSFERRAVIAYSIDNNIVRITNIFYGGRDYEALYRRDADETGASPETP
jgi:toxin ParE1/3/4